MLGAGGGCWPPAGDTQRWRAVVALPRRGRQLDAALGRDKLSRFRPRPAWPPALLHVTGPPGGPPPHASPLWISRPPSCCPSPRGLGRPARTGRCPQPRGAPAERNALTQSTAPPAQRRRLSRGDSARRWRFSPDPDGTGCQRLHAGERAAERGSRSGNYETRCLSGAHLVRGAR